MNADTSTTSAAAEPAEIYIGQTAEVQSRSGPRAGRIEELSTGSWGERIGVRFPDGRLVWHPRRAVRVLAGYRPRVRSNTERLR